MDDPISDLPDEPLEVARITVKEKWQGAVGPGSGFVAVPVALLRLQAIYGLTATEMLILINLLAHWWEPDKPVYPRSTTIAKRMGIDTRTVQRATKRLAAKGLLERGKSEDGFRTFNFNNLATRVARDLPLAHKAQVGETHGV